MLLLTRDFGKSWNIKDSNEPTIIYHISFAKWARFYSARIAALFSFVYRRNIVWNVLGLHGEGCEDLRGYIPCLYEEFVCASVLDLAISTAEMSVQVLELIRKSCLVDDCRRKGIPNRFSKQKAHFDMIFEISKIRNSCWCQILGKLGKLGKHQGVIFKYFQGVNFDKHLTTL